MVKLAFSFKLKASFQEFWNYVSQWENIQNYDPCIKRAQLLQSCPNKIGSTYNITTITNGKQSNLIYKVTSYTEEKIQGARKNRIQISGSNEKVQARDEINLQELPESKDDYNLFVEYKLQINYIGVNQLSPAIMNVLNGIAEESSKGIKKKCIQMWGETAIQEKQRKGLIL